MTASETETGAPCDYCGVAVDPHGWFGLEVQRPDSRHRLVPGWASIDTWDVVFCSQEHAVAWLSSPLPVQPGPASAAPGDLRRSALVDRAVIAAIVGALVLAAVGLWSIVRWVLG